jgi:hypothetical protein
MKQGGKSARGEINNKLYHSERAIAIEGRYDEDRFNTSCDGMRRPGLACFFAGKPKLYLGNALTTA